MILWRVRIQSGNFVISVLNAAKHLWNLAWASLGLFRTGKMLSTKFSNLLFFFVLFSVLANKFSMSLKKVCHPHTHTPQNYTLCFLFHKHTNTYTFHNLYLMFLSFKLSKESWWTRFSWKNCLRVDLDKAAALGWVKCPSTSISSANWTLYKLNY